MQQGSNTNMEQFTLVHTVKCQCVLGESVFYSDDRQQVIWNDIEGRVIHTLDWDTKFHRTYGVSSRLCWLIPFEHGGFVGGFEDEICLLDDNFCRQKTLWVNKDFAERVRLNDAKADRSGRIFFGTMDDEEKEAKGNIYQLVVSKEPRIIQRDFTVSNGPAFSTCGKYMYAVSSAEKCIYRLFLSAAGEYHSPEVFIRFGECFGWPDGVTVDADDHLWIAGWDGKGVFRFTPEGELIAKLSTPAPLTTSVAFVGPTRRHIAVTSASRDLTNEQLALYPESGNLFIYSVEATGVVETPATLSD